MTIISFFKFIISNKSLKTKIATYVKKYKVAVDNGEDAKPEEEVSAEETHEEETPSHHFSPPLLILLTTESHDVQRYHTDDANAAKNVEGMISLFHKRSGKTSSSGRWLTFISSGISFRTEP